MEGKALCNKSTELCAQALPADNLLWGKRGTWPTNKDIRRFSEELENQGEC